MTLFKLSISNMKKSVKDYAIYFFTLALGVAIFYVYGAIETQTAMLRLSTNMSDVVKLMTQIIDSVSVFIACVLGFLIIYASRFLMKRRNKEFGLYLLLGMGKRKVSFMLFLETLLIGIVSLVIGSLLGIGVSQITSALVANMFEADMTSFRFVFSGKALAKTCLYFGIIYVVVIIFNTILISKCRLIDMFQSAKRTETVKMRNPWMSLVVFALAVSGLVYAYYQVVVNIDDMYGGEIMLYIGIGSVCTVLFFWSVSGMLLRVVSSVKSVYYRGLNTFVIRQFSSQVNTNIFSISIICLMLFFTICVLGSALAVKDSMNSYLKKYCTADLYILNSTDGSADDSMQNIFSKYGFDIDENFSDYVSVHSYASDDFTVYDSLGDTYYKEIYDSEPDETENSDEDIMSVSDYNKLAALYGHECIELADDEYAVVANYGQMVDVRNELLKDGAEICVFGVSLKPAMDTCVDGNIRLATQTLETGTFIVPDSVVSGEKPSCEIFVAKYNTDDTAEIDNITAEILTIESVYMDYTANNISDKMLEVNTKSDIAAASVGMGAIASFVGLYIGLIFLISGAAILALKELSESTDNANRYRILSMLGANRRMTDRALLRQMVLFFLFPLALAIVHSVFGMMCSRKILGIIGVTELAPSLLATAGVLVFIYGGYFLITYLSGRKIINEG